jgi:enoyl-CoA hydratase/carnithine racemase
MPTLTTHESVFVLDLGPNENSLHPDWVTEVEGHLDKVEAGEGPVALVTTGRGRHYSNGLDLGWLTEHLDEADDYVARCQRLIARVLVLPMTTVAALPGHAFAVGAMLSLAHDYRVMRADRGYWSLPEADLGLPFTPGMNAIVAGVLPASTTREAMTTARRYGGVDALSEGIVHAAVPESDVMATALEYATRNAARAGANLGRIKERLYADVADRLREPVAVRA